LADKEWRMVETEEDIIFCDEFPKTSLLLTSHKVVRRDTEEEMDKVIEELPEEKRNRARDLKERNKRVADER